MRPAPNPEAAGLAGAGALEAVGFAKRCRVAGLVLTGEGCLDAQTASGKTVSGVVRVARAAGVPVAAVVGRTGPGWERLGLAAVASLAERFGLEAAIREPARLVEEAVAADLASFVRARPSGPA